LKKYYHKGGTESVAPGASREPSGEGKGAVSASFEGKGDEGGGELLDGVLLLSLEEKIYSTPHTFLGPSKKRKRQRPGPVFFEKGLLFREP